MQTLPQLLRSLFIISVLTTTGLAQQSPEALALSDQRKNLQGAFSVCNSKIYPNPDKAPIDAHIALERVAKQIQDLKTRVLELESGHCNIWYSESYWARTYWNSSLGGRYLVEKLRTAMSALSTLAAPEFGPFARPDLNALQKTLDGCRACLEIDRELEIAAKSYSSQRVYYVPVNTIQQRRAPYSDGTTSSF
jgi:hypothetical protein